MEELNSLAGKKQRIEDDLFHTSNLGKIYNLIGEKRQKMIIAQRECQKRKFG